MEISYNGSAYHGWQKQPEALSVQSVLENALQTALQQQTKTTGAGRTDTGVHARQFFVHFDAEFSIAREQLVFKLNTILPRDIAVKAIFEVEKTTHARFDAVGREYTYFVNTQKDPFKTGTAYYIKRKLDIDRMNAAAKIILQYSDFKAFSKVKTGVKTFNCKIEYAFWEKKGDDLIFKIKADRFLRNMVRAIVGTLIEIGLKQREVAELQKIIEGRNRSKAGKSVPAHGLFLTGVEY